jgi:hypothetical protein
MVTGEEEGVLVMGCVAYIEAEHAGTMLECFLPMDNGQVGGGRGNRMPPPHEQRADLQEKTEEPNE